MPLALLLLLLLVGFLMGSIPSAYLLGRARGIDIRQHGSGNVGATNAFRVLGRGMGALCLLADMLKGFIPVRLISIAYAYIDHAPLNVAAWMWLMGLAAIVGHMFSPFLGFKGGKGVATSIGVLLAIIPGALLIAVAAGILIIWLTGYVSLASMVCAASLPLLLLVLHLPHPPWTSIGVTALLATAIVWKHRANIRRLRAGTESKIFDRLNQKLGRTKDRHPE